MDFINRKSKIVINIQGNQATLSNEIYPINGYYYDLFNEYKTSLGIEDKFTLDDINTIVNVLDCFKSAYKHDSHVLFN